jgi:hypothetical protein
MHMWHHVTNHLIISNDKDSNSENRIKLCVRDMAHQEVVPQQEEEAPLQEDTELVEELEEDQEEEEN